MSRKYATRDSPFPKEREGCLDVNNLINHRVTKQRLEEQDALLFYQMILPICDTRRSDIVDDGRESYYSKVANFTNINKARVHDAGYGHIIRDVDPAECVHHDGILFSHGAWGGGHDIHLRWDKYDQNNIKYRKDITDCMFYTRFINIKKILKWNDNKERMYLFCMFQYH